MTEFCKRGHEWTPENTDTRPRPKDPTKTMRRCLKCAAYLQRMRYRNDPVTYAKVRKYALEAYRKKIQCETSVTVWIDRRFRSHRAGPSTR